MSRALTATALLLALAACGSGETGGAPNTGASDTGASDTGAADISAVDTAAADTGASDTGAPDTGAPDTAPTPVYQAITVAQAQALLASDPRPLLINVHVPFEGEIVGTDLHVPYNQLDQLEAALKHDKGAWALLYCKTGPMSVQATKKLVQLGYWNLLDMPAGFVTWKSKGLPFSKSKGGG